VHGNRLIVQFDQHENSSLHAFDFASGNEVWKVGRGTVSWSSPILIEEPE
jgi:hypothetical protein